jgi:TolA-binding protein
LFKSTSLLLISAGCGGFFGAYLAIPPAAPPPVLDISALASTHAKLDTLAKQFSELQTQVETTKQATNTLQETLLARVQALETQLQQDNTPPVIAQNETQATPTPNQDLAPQAPELDTQENMHSPDFNSRQRALRALFS